MIVEPPRTIEELQYRVDAIAGQTIERLAQTINIQIPHDLRREKGWVGQLLEKLLGTNAGNLSAPDFMNLGIELKTIPINSAGLPQESTYVCVVPLKNLTQQRWQYSHVKQKLSNVLWIPIESDRKIVLAQRRVGTGVFWQMDNVTEAILKRDYDEFMEHISLGRVDQISSSQGEFLQIRPKAANSSKLTESIGEDGETIKTLPRGFYLRPSFTKKILETWREQS